MEQKRQRRETNIHFSCVVIGFLLALCLTLALGASYGGSGGPYQISSGSDVSAFVINTETGHMWKVTRAHNYDFGTPLDRKSRRQDIVPYID